LSFSKVPLRFFRAAPRFKLLARALSSKRARSSFSFRIRRPRLPHHVR
jgi:hypothetical protein